MIGILYGVLSSYQMKISLLPYPITMFIFVILKQGILFQAHFSLNIMCGFKLPVSALVELIFWSETMMVQLSKISREVRSSLQLRVEILFSFSVVVGMTALSHLIG